MDEGKRLRSSETWSQLPLDRHVKVEYQLSGNRHLWDSTSYFVFVFVFFKSLWSDYSTREQSTAICGMCCRATENLGMILLGLRYFSQSLQRTWPDRSRSLLLAENILILFVCLPTVGPRFYWKNKAKTLRWSCRIISGVWYTAQSVSVLSQYSKREGRTWFVDSKFNFRGKIYATGDQISRDLFLVLKKHFQTKVNMIIWMSFCNYTLKMAALK